MMTLVGIDRPEELDGHVGLQLKRHALMTPLVRDIAGGVVPPLPPVVLRQLAPSGTTAASPIAQRRETMIAIGGGIIEVVSSSHCEPQPF